MKYCVKTLTSTFKYNFLHKFTTPVTKHCSALCVLLTGSWGARRAPCQRWSWRRAAPPAGRRWGWRGRRTGGWGWAPSGWTGLPERSLTPPTGRTTHCRWNSGKTKAWWDFLQQSTQTISHKWTDFITNLKNITFSNNLWQHLSMSCFILFPPLVFEFTSHKKV